MGRMTFNSKFSRYKFYYPGAYYHIYNRGNGRENIFLAENDFLFYLKRLKQSLKRYLVKILAYCLMPNHLHLLVKQEGEKPIFKFISSLHTSYVKVFNKKYNKVGHLFQDRFKQVIVENDNQLLHVTRYIHLNPVKDGLVKNLEDFKWSSYQEYLGKGGFGLCDKEIIKELMGGDDFEKEYQEFIEAKIREEEEEQIKDLIIEPF